MADLSTEDRLSWAQIEKKAMSVEGIDSLEWMDAARKHIDNQKREITRLRADAERYRWFRDHPDSCWEVVSLFQRRPTVVMKFQFESLDHIPLTLDVAVDQARNLTALKDAT
jgi:hypothetical protein